MLYESKLAADAAELWHQRNRDQRERGRPRPVRDEVLDMTDHELRWRDRPSWRRNGR